MIAALSRAACHALRREHPAACSGLRPGELVGTDAVPGPQAAALPALQHQVPARHRMGEEVIVTLHVHRAHPALLALIGHVVSIASPPSLRAIAGAPG